MAVTTGKIDRKYMAHFLDAGSLCGGKTPSYERLGKDLEEYNVELNPDTETSKNIIGESTFKHNGYEVSSEADPYYAEADSTLSQKLQEIIDNRYKDDNLKTTAVEVHLWKEASSGAYEAYAEDVILFQHPTVETQVVTRFLSQLTTQETAEKVLTT